MSELKTEMITKVVEVRSLKIYGNPNGEKEGLVVFLKVREAFPLNATGEPENFTVHCSFERFGGGGRAGGANSTEAKWVQVAAESAAGATCFMSLSGIILSMKEKVPVKVEFEQMGSNEYGLICEGSILFNSPEQIFL